MPYYRHLLGETKKILLSTDGSRFSEGAIQESIFFAQSCGADLFVLHVMESNPEFDTIGHQAVAQKEAEIKSHIENIKKMAVNEDIKTHLIVRRSDEIDRAIIEEAEKNEADVILMGRRGRRGLKKLFMGAITAKILKNSPCKVLVVPKDFMIKGETIILATDGSPCSEIAQKEAVSMVGRCDFLKNIIVISVAKSEANLPEAKKNVEKVKEEIAGVNKKIQIECVTEVGKPFKVIMDKAIEKNADIIIMGKYGKNALETFLLGSTTEDVIANAPCSVMVVK
jgi:nucleotide-binding universal stress UspA family protein